MTTRVGIHATKHAGEPTIEKQILRLEQFADKQGWQVVHTETSFARLVRRAKRGTIEVILFWSLESVTKKGVLSALRTFSNLSRHGILYHSFREPAFDTAVAKTDDFAKLIRKLNTLQKKLHAKCVKAGLEQRRNAGNSNRAE